MNKRVYRDSGVMNARGIRVLLVLCCGFVLMFAALTYRMVIMGNSYKSKALNQWSNEVKIEAKRGNILDNNGFPLATSVDVYRVDVDLNSLKKYSKANKVSMDDMATKLSATLSLNKNDVLTKITKGVQAVTIARRVEKDRSDAVSRLNYRGIIVSPDTERYYTDGDFLSQILGTTNSDGTGQAGIELEYNRELSGTPGLQTTEIDGGGDDLPYTISEFTKPIPGKDVQLTINETVQGFAEKAAEQAITDNKAKAVTVMIMDPNTGEMLAMANKKSFNPNDSRANMTSDQLTAMWNNRAVSQAYEPGSIFKVFTLAAALQEKVVKESDTFNCTGSTVVMGQTIHCWDTNGHGLQTLKQILENSCNMGFINVGERLGIKKLTSYIAKYGFGKKTGIDLPNESTGVVKQADKMTQLDLATMSFGQVNAITPVQYMQAFNAVANGGKKIVPHVMKQVSHQDSSGQTVIDKTYSQYYSNNKPVQIISPDVCAELRNDLEAVVQNGGGKKAFVKGYDIAGKTGTAQKLDTEKGGYIPGGYVSTFVGMAPADKPRFTVLVQIDQPGGAQYYAGQIAAPVGKQVFTDLFNYYSVHETAQQQNADESMKQQVIVPNLVGMNKKDATKLLQDNLLSSEFDGTGDIVRDVSPKPGALVKEGTKITLYTDNTVNLNQEIVVPDLTGYTKSEASNILINLGLKATFEGNGLVSSQTIAANTKVQIGESIKLGLVNVTD